MQLVSIELTDDEADYIPHPAKKVSTKTTRPVQVKMEKRENNIALKTKTKRLNSNNVRVSDLPDFAQDKWRATFLPTLYNKFFTSDEPFDGFNKGCDQFIALLQTIFGEVFPGIDYEVTSSDSIHLLVCYFNYLLYPSALTTNVFLCTRHIIESTKSDPI